MTEETKNTDNTSTPLQPSDLVYVSEIARPQDERVESFCKVFCDLSKLEKIGHALLIFECEVDGKARVGSIANVELQELRGKTGLLRAEELVALQLAIMEHVGVPKMEVGAEAGLKYSREMWAAGTEFSEAK